MLFFDLCMLRFNRFKKAIHNIAGKAFLIYTNLLRLNSCISVCKYMQDLS